MISLPEQPEIIKKSEIAPVENTQTSQTHPIISKVARLKQTLDQEIEQLKGIKYTINEPESNLDLLIQRYHSKKSAIGRVTDWYGSSALWKKIVIGLFIGAVSVGLGFLCHAPIIITVVSIVCYLIFAMVCMDHYKVTNQQIKLMCEDVLELEKSLNETVKLFNEFSEKLHAVYIVAQDLSAHFASDVAQMEISVETLNVQLVEYKKILENLSESEQTITAGSLSLTHAIEQYENGFHASCESLKHQTNALSTIQDDLVQVHKNLEKAAETLCEPQLYESFLYEYKKVAETAKKMQMIVDAFLSNPCLRNIVSHSSAPFEEEKEDVPTEASLLIKKADFLIHESTELLKTTDDLQNEPYESMPEKIALAEARMNVLFSCRN